MPYIYYARLGLGYTYVHNNNVRHRGRSQTHLLDLVVIKSGVPGAEVSGQ